VKDFLVRNEHGRIVFPGVTDLTHVNLSVIDIAKNGVEIYKQENEQPPVGCKLNRDAIVTLFDQKPKKGQTPEEKEDELIKVCAKNENMEHVSLDQDYSWTFKL
jgi:hypothetical protein